MSKIETEFVECGYWVPVERTKPLIDPPLIDEDTAVTLALVLLDLFLVGFIVCFTIGHWGQL